MYDNVSVKGTCVDPYITPDIQTCTVDTDCHDGNRYVSIIQKSPAFVRIRNSYQMKNIVALLIYVCVISVLIQWKTIAVATSYAKLVKLVVAIAGKGKWCCCIFSSNSQSQFPSSGHSPFKHPLAHAVFFPRV